MPESQMAGDIRVQQLSYDGRVSSLYWIFIKIVLLNIITLTIYRFWGKTRLRTYIWSHMTLQGERLEYTGTGGELFLGFLIVIGLFTGVYACVFVATFVFGAQPILTAIIQLILPLMFFYLPMVAIYAAQRYRLTRTLWRGIRGGMSGSAWTYGLRAAGYGLVVALSLGLATPWAQMRLAEQRFNNSYFGDAKASLQGRSAPVYLGFLLGFVAYVLLMIILITVLWRGFDLGTAFATAFQQHGADQPDAEKARAIASISAAYVIFLIGAAIAGVFAFSWYASAFFKALAAGLSFDNLTFRSTMSALDYFRFWLGNIAIVIVTLGLGLPVVVHRGLRFFANRLEIIGAIDVDRLQQNTLPKPKTGEGLLETFDSGFW